MGDIGHDALDPDPYGHGWRTPLVHFVADVFV